MNQARKEVAGGEANKIEIYEFFSRGTLSKNQKL
jgi:hypothetical protein